MADFEGKAHLRNLLRILHLPRSSDLAVFRLLPALASQQATLWDRIPVLLENSSAPSTRAEPSLFCAKDKSCFRTPHARMFCSALATPGGILLCILLEEFWGGTAVGRPTLT